LKAGAFHSKIMLMPVLVPNICSVSPCPLCTSHFGISRHPWQPVTTLFRHLHIPLSVDGGISSKTKTFKQMGRHLFRSKDIFVYNRITAGNLPITIQKRKQEAFMSTDTDISKGNEKFFVFFFGLIFLLSHLARLSSTCVTYTYYIICRTDSAKFVSKITTCFFFLRRYVRVWQTKIKILQCINLNFKYQTSWKRGFWGKINKYMGTFAGDNDEPQNQSSSVTCRVCVRARRGDFDGKLVSDLSTDTSTLCCLIYKLSRVKRETKRHH
jgi:hypothetical protein